VVPDAVSIVGFDNWEIMAEATRPSLTSVDMNLKDLGRRAGLRLLDRIAGKQSRGVERLPCTLVVRDSCGANGSLRARKTDEGTGHAPVLTGSV
jgi:LacI family transcriptional regulator